MESRKRVCSSVYSVEISGQFWSKNSCKNKMRQASSILIIQNPIPAEQTEERHEYCQQCLEEIYGVG